MVKFGTKKYISKKERARIKAQEAFDNYKALWNWHDFFAIFPRRIIEGDISYFAVGRMYRRGVERFSHKSEDFIYYKWHWEYASEFSNERRTPQDPRLELRGKRVA